MTKIYLNTVIGYFSPDKLGVETSQVRPGFDGPHLGLCYNYLACALPIHLLQAIFLSLGLTCLKFVLASSIKGMQTFFIT